MHQEKKSQIAGAVLTLKQKATLTRGFLQL